MSAKVKVKLPDLTIETPPLKFWRRVGIDAVKDIRKRTESRGMDVDRQPLKKYSEKYEQKRADAGRTTRPNLSFTSRMLSAMALGIRPSKGGLKLRLIGESGFKAWVNEQRGRVFFGLDKLQKKKITKLVTAWITRANGLKR